MKTSTSSYGCRNPFAALIQSQDYMTVLVLVFLVMTISLFNGMSVCRISTLRSSTKGEVEAGSRVSRVSESDHSLTVTRVCIQNASAAGALLSPIRLSASSV